MSAWLWCLWWVWWWTQMRGLGGGGEPASNYGVQLTGLGPDNTSVGSGPARQLTHDR